MADFPENKDETTTQSQAIQNTSDSKQETSKPTEHNGPKGLEPTRYGDWERNGRCTDF